MYTQYFLKFASPEECYEIFKQLEWCDKNWLETHQFTMDGHAGGIDEVGLIVDQPATYDEETLEELTPATYDEETLEELTPATYGFKELTPTTYLDGWHVNIVIKESLPEILEPFIVTPQTPNRIFAGFEV